MIPNYFPKLKLVKKSFLFAVFSFLFLSILSAQPLPGSYYDFLEQTENMDMEIRPRGYRILNKIHRLPSGIIENLVNYFGDFQGILAASIEDLDDVEGIGEIRATYIKNGLIKMKQLVLLDRNI